MEQTEQITVITDANILIDYVKSNKKILKLFARVFNKIHIPYDIFNEVNGLSLKDIKSFGFNVYYPDLDTYYRATNAENGLSFQDNICILDAEKNGWSVITNDRKLRVACANTGVDTIWGLQVMLIMVEKKLLKKSEAVKTAEKIHSVNSRITLEVIEDFKIKI